MKNQTVPSIAVNCMLAFSVILSFYLVFQQHQLTKKIDNLYDVVTAECVEKVKINKAQPQRIFPEAESVVGPATYSTGRQGNYYLPILITVAIVFLLLVIASVVRTVKLIKIVWDTIRSLR